MSHLFYNCENLNTIIWPENSPFKSHYCSFSYMFYNCTSLISIDLSSSYFNGVFDLSYMFSNCKNLQYIKLNGYLDWQKGQMTVYYIEIRQYVIIKTATDNIFQNCISLKELNLLSLNINYDNDIFNNLEGCLFNEYKTEKIKCSKYMGFYYCGECNNNNKNEYCSKEIAGKNYSFFYLHGQSELSYEKRQCFWSNNNSNFAEYEFINNLEDNNNYYQYFCTNFCEICSNDKLACTKCKKNFYPIDKDYNNYINKVNNSFLCYEKNAMNNYYLDLADSQFKKCNEKCKEFDFGVDFCSKC